MYMYVYRWNYTADLYKQAATSELRYKSIDFSLD